MATTSLNLEAIIQKTQRRLNSVSWEISEEEEEEFWSPKRRSV